MRRKELQFTSPYSHKFDLCKNAQDFFHDFCASSDRVHAGYIQAFSGGSPNPSTGKSARGTLLGEYFKDTLLYKNCKQFKGKSEKYIYDYTSRELSHYCDLLDLFNQSYMKYFQKRMSSENKVSSQKEITKQIVTQLQSGFNQLPPHPFLNAVLPQPIQAHARKKKRTKRTKRRVKRSKRSKRVVKGGAPKRDRLYEQIQSLLYKYELEDSYEFLENLKRDPSCSTASCNELKQVELETILETIYELSEKEDPNSRRTKRTRQGPRKRYVESLDTESHKYNDWHNKYDIYESLNPNLEEFNQQIGTTIGPRFKIRTIHDFLSIDSLQEFSEYYDSLVQTCLRTVGMKQFNFTNYIQWLSTTLSPVGVTIPLLGKLKMEGNQWAIIKQFGKCILKSWYLFIEPNASVNYSPAVSPVSGPPVVNPNNSLSPEDKACDTFNNQILRKIYEGNVNDESTHKLFTKFLSKLTPKPPLISGKSPGIQSHALTTVNPFVSSIQSSTKQSKKSKKSKKRPKKGGAPGVQVINNGSLMRSFPVLFQGKISGECYPVSVLDSMANCSKLDPTLQNPSSKEPFEIVYKLDDTHYQLFSIRDITNTGCTLKFEFANGLTRARPDAPSKPNVITYEDNLVYNQNPLSVRNVISKVIIELGQGIQGSTLNQRLTSFKQLIEDDPEALSNRLLRIFCMKLLGDKGQEMYAVAEDMHFIANDIPSADRFIFNKLFLRGKNKGPNSGGLVTNKKYELLQF